MKRLTLACGDYNCVPHSLRFTWSETALSEGGKTTMVKPSWGHRPLTRDGNVADCRAVRAHSTTGLPKCSRQCWMLQRALTQMLLICPWSCEDRLSDGRGISHISKRILPRYFRSPHSLFPDKVCGNMLTPAKNYMLANSRTDLIFFAFTLVLPSVLLQRPSTFIPQIALRKLDLTE